MSCRKCGYGQIMTKHPYSLEVAGVPQVAYTVYIEGEDLEVAVAGPLKWPSQFS